MSAKVISISFNSTPKPQVEAAETKSGEQNSTDFLAIEERNSAKREKMRKEREQANKGVLKSYKIK